MEGKTERSRRLKVRRTKKESGLYYAAATTQADILKAIHFGILRRRLSEIMLFCVWSPGNC